MGHRMTPYRKQKRIHFWKSATQSSLEQILNGLYKPKFQIGRQTRIATAGSCFAQHIRAQLIEHGFRFLDLETAPPFFPGEKLKAYGFEMFSARFGNIYTTEQLHQLAQRAFDAFETNEPYWEKDGRFFDPLRSTIEPSGFVSIQEASDSRQSHLRQVRKMLEQADVMIFTLGLTEAWISRTDNTVFPLCPGVFVGRYSPESYCFKNFDAQEVTASFEKFRAIVKAHNPGVKFVLTVSPVPLEATASEQNVILATTYSKSVLRAAAGQLYQSYDDVDYFPSYEIFTSPLFKGQFYEENMRDPTPEGIARAMTLFFSGHRAEGMPMEASGPSNEAEAGVELAKQKAEQFASQQQIICDEMLLGGENCDS
jgi:hypothetical protein